MITSLALFTSLNTSFQNNFAPSKKSNIETTNMAIPTANGRVITFIPTPCRSIPTPCKSIPNP